MIDTYDHHTMFIVQPTILLNFFYFIHHKYVRLNKIVCLSLDKPFTPSLLFASKAVTYAAKASPAKNKLGLK
jgi:hypothetical protein